MSKQVLIVESDSVVSHEMRSALEAQGFAVDEMADSRTSVERIRKRQPDLVVLAADLANGQSGYIVCRELKKDDALKGIPVVITGDPEKFASHRKLKTRADAYVAKPLTSPTLIAAIGSLIGLPEKGGSEESLNLDELVSDAEEISVEPGDGEETIRGDPELELLDSAFSTSLNEDGSDDQTQGGIEAGLEAAPELGAELEMGLGGTDSFARPELDRFEDSSNAQSDSRVRELEEELAGLRAELEAARSPGSGKSDKDFFALKEAANKRDKEIIRLKGELNEKDTEIVDLKDRETALEQQLSILQSEASQRDTQVKAAAARVEQAGAERKKLEQQLAAAKDEGRNATTRLKALEGELKEVAENLESARAEKEALEAGVRRSATEAEGLRTELEEVQGQAERSSSEADALRGELSEIQSKLAEQTGQLEAVQEELDSARSRLAELEKSAAEHEARVVRLEAKREKTKDALSVALQLLDSSDDDGLEDEANA